MASGGMVARGWAVAAMVALLLVVGGLVAVVVGSNGAFFAVVLDAALSAAVVAATAWWAFTTRRVWKRRLNVALAVLVAAALLAVLVGFGLAQALGVVALAAGTLGYAAAARRALATAARRVPAGRGGSERAAAAARPWLLVNSGSGGGKAGRLGLVAAARARGVQVHLLDPGDDPAALARQAVAAGAEALGVAGGDGSLGLVAAVAVEADLPFVCIPTTHAVLLGALRGERALLRLDFRDPAGRRYRDVLLLLVANNAYELGRAAELGARERLDDGVLQVSALRARTGAALAGLAARIAARRAPPGGDWAQWTATALRVDAGSADLPAGIDGEAVVLHPPLQFRVLPRALRVLLPRELQPRPREVHLHGWATVRRVGAIAVGRETGP